MQRRTGAAAAITLGLALLAPVTVTHAVPMAHPPTVRWSTGTPRPFDHPTDTPASAYLDTDGSFWFQQSAALYGKDDPRYWDFFTGTTFDDAERDTKTSEAVNPKNSKDRNDDTSWRCDHSPTGNESTVYAEDVEAGTGYAHRNYCDLVGTWVDPDTGYWYGLVHNEFTPRPNGDGLHYDAIDYAVSHDRGKTWTIKGNAITSPYSTKRGDTAAFPEDTYYYGDGDPRLLADPASGYFYVFYGSRVVDKGGSWGAFAEHVARAPMSAKMATGSWQKFRNGHWDSPGVGGKEGALVPVSDRYPNGVLPSAEEYKPSTPGTIAQQQARGQLAASSDLFVMNVSWNAYLGMYIGEPEGTGKEKHFYGTTDLVTQQWVDLGATPGYEGRSWYRWMSDTATATTSTIVGKTFRSYCSIDCPGDKDGLYVDVTARTATPAAPINPAKTYRIGGVRKQSLVQRPGGGLALGSSDRSTKTAGWKFVATGDGAYVIQNTGSGFALGVGDTVAQRSWGTVPRATELSTKPTVGQQWWVVPITGSSSFRLINRWSGLALSVGGGGGGPVATGPLRTWSSPQADADRRSPKSQRLTVTGIR